MFIVSLTYKKPLEEVEQFLEQHMDFLDKYYTSGHFIASGRKVPRVGGVILVKADSTDIVHDIIAEDPFHSQEIADYHVTEFIPTMTAPKYDGLKEEL